MALADPPTLKRPAPAAPTPPAASHVQPKNGRGRLEMHGMDEPFAALDAQTRTLLHAQLQELWIQTHKTILFVTHSVGEAVRLADRIVILHSHPGRIRRTVDVALPH